FARKLACDLLDLHQVADGVDQAAHLGGVITHDALADLAQPEGAQRLAVSVLRADLALDLGDLELSHEIRPPGRHAGAASGPERRPRAAGHGGPPPLRDA